MLWPKLQADENSQLRVYQKQALAFDLKLKVIRQYMNLRNALQQLQP